VCDDRRTLLWFANQRAIEYHPSLSTVGDQGHQTHLILDLDPPEEGGFGLAVQAAHLVHQVLADLELDAVVKTSGAKGVHVFVPIAPMPMEDVAAATRAISARAAALDPDVATTAFIKEDRGGRVFVDPTRVGGGTVAAAYSPRVRPGVPVSFPLEWDELDAADPRDFTIVTAPDLLDRRADCWAARMPSPQVVPDALLAEGHEIPVPRVAAMHEGKRRARARRTE
jgi:DNA ligase D-like protein (predicted polymerase)